MTLKEMALKLRPYIEKASASLSDEDAIDAVELFPVWKFGKEYAVDVRIRYDGKLYRVVQAHTSQADWLPPDVPALYTEVAAPGEIPIWKQPTGAQDAYNTGDKVWYPDKTGSVYRSLIDGNVWSPVDYPQGWEIVT